MSCSEYQHNMSLAMQLFAPPNQTYQTHYHVYVNVKYYVHHVGLPIVFAFGILGNILNLLILTRKSLQSSMDHMEKSVHLGLVVLAVSDLMFCLIAFPRSFTPNNSVYFGRQSVFLLYYEVYYESIINIFLLSSTWLTVVMATGRYVAICHPLHARGFVDLQRTKAVLCGVFFCSVLFNMPLFWRYYILTKNCAAQCVCHTRIVGKIFSRPSFTYPYYTFVAIFGVVIPLVVLAFCNVCLIRALRQSQKMRKMYSANQASNNSGHRLTPTLITIVILFFILVAPSEFIKLSRHLAIWKSNKGYHIYVTAITFTNFMQAINFAVNFILYCAINVHFRKTVYNFLCCHNEKTDFYKSQQGPTTIVVNISEPETDV